MPASTISDALFFRVSDHAPRGRRRQIVVWTNLKIEGMDWQ